MSPQADYVVSNGTGAAVRSDINGQLAAIVSNNSGASAPATTYAYMLWADTSTNLLKLRNGANSAWITVGDLTAANLGLATLASPTFTGTATIPTLTVSTAANIPVGSAASPTLYFTGDSNTGLYSPGADQVALSTGGTGRLFINSSGSVGIGTSSPGSLLTSYPGNVSTLGAKASTGLLIDNNGSVGNISQIGLGYTFSGTYHPVAIAAITDSGSGSTRADLHFATRSPTTDTAPDTRMIIKSDGKVGIGTTSPGSYNVAADDLVVAGSGDTGITIAAGTSSYSSIYFADGTTNPAPYRGIVGYNHASDELVFYSNALLRATIDSSGRLLVGTSSAPSAGQGTLSKIVVQGYVGGDADVGLISLQRGEAATSITADENIGRIAFNDNTGGTFAWIQCTADAAAGNNDFPGRLVFSTTADGASSPTERLRIANNGAWGLAGANYGSSGQVLTSNGSGSAPTWSSAGGVGTLQAWVNFNGTGTVAIRASGNVSSITDNGTGDYTVSFTTAMPDANYAALASPSGEYSVNYGGQTGMFSTSSYTESAPATGSARVTFSNYSSGTFDPKYVNVAIFR